MIIRLIHHYDVPERRRLFFAIHTQLPLDEVAMILSILEMVYDYLPHDVMAEEVICQEHILYFWQRYRPQDRLYRGTEDVPHRDAVPALDICDIRFAFDAPQEREKKRRTALDLAQRLPLRRILLEADREMLLKQRHSTYFAPRLVRADEILASGIIPHGIRNIFDHDCGGILDKPAEELVKEIFEPYQT